MRAPEQYIRCCSRIKPGDQVYMYTARGGRDFTAEKTDDTALIKVIGKSARYGAQILLGSRTPIVSLYINIQGIDFLNEQGFKLIPDWQDHRYVWYVILSGLYDGRIAKIVSA